MWRVRRIQDRMASIFLTPNRMKLRIPRLSPQDVANDLCSCYLYFRSHQELSQLPSLGNVRVTCPGKNGWAPLHGLRVLVTRLASTQSKGKWAMPTQHATEKITQDVSGAA